jgi:hypothetical protein
MSTTVTSIIENLENSKLFQIGTRSGSKPSVRFGLSELDSAKRWRTISVYPNSVELIREILMYDSRSVDDDRVTHILKHDKETGREYINIKISAVGTKFVSSTGDILSINHIQRGDNLILVVKPLHWSFNGKTGVCLRAKTVMVCGGHDSGDDDDDFVIM